MNRRLYDKQVKIRTGSRRCSVCYYYRSGIYELKQHGGCPVSYTHLGNAIGKEFRASLAVTDENLANAVIKKLQPNKTE